MSEGNLDFVNILIESSIFVKLVLVVLIGFSLISWTIIFSKKKFYKKLRSENLKFRDFYKDSVKDVSKSSKKKLFKSSSLFSIYRAGMRELDLIINKIKKEHYSSIKKYFSHNGTVAIDRALKKGEMEVQTMIDKKLGVLASIGSISPFVGLFGTVIGIIDSFQNLGLAGGASLETVAPGIAEALIATAIGIGVAIPAVWFYNSFNTENDKINQELEAFKQDFVNLIERTTLIQNEDD